MTTISTTSELAALCERLLTLPYVTVDTEFMRENTYYSKLCLIQVAGPDEAVAIDVLAPGLDLAPFLTLMSAERPLKVFHAARQDLEIFYHLIGRVPAPIFDTQVAAMVCGFGDSVGYETLVAKLAGARIDKSSRFTDWSRRPLSERQLHYALSDVVQLRTAYETLSHQVERTRRASWVEEEMAILTSPETYNIDPREVWRRFNLRNPRPRFLAILREVAAWREIEAQSRDLPRNRVLRDEILTEIASQSPANIEQLGRIRGIGRGLVESRRGEALLAAIAAGRSLPNDQCPSLPERQERPRGIAPTVELLRVLLKQKCEQHDVAPKLIASGDDLELIAMDDAAEVPALYGWRRDVFGNDAIALKHGKLALSIARGEIQVTPLQS
ncbi:MAG: ribonuclease D [Alphaproteobacteria bacterium]|nr:ribonuclease D [Alphaproteobacteria bacterium]